MSNHQHGSGKLKASTHQQDGKTFTLVIIKNPFDMHYREIRRVSVSEYGAEVLKLLPSVEEGQAWHLSVNGKLMEPDEAARYIPAPGDFVAACPVMMGGGGGGGGKNPLAVIAGLAVTVLSFGLGGIVAGTLGFAAGSAGAMLVTAGIMYLGGSLLGGMSKKPGVDMPDGMNEGSAWENGYGWGEMRPLMNQGNPIPLTYGTVRVSGQCIGQHVTTDGKKQYLNLLLSGGEGPVDNISNLLINNNPIDNFSATVNGLLDQTLNRTLALNVASSATTQADATTGWEVEFSFPNGMRGSSRFGIGSVSLLVEYKPFGAPYWISLGQLDIYSFSLTNYKYTYRKENLASGRYEVRLTMIAANMAGGCTCVWSRLSDVDYTEDVDVQYRTGLNNQAVIPYFKDSFADQVFSLEMTDIDWLEYQTEGNGGSGLEIEFTFPSGLCYVNDDGSPAESWAKLDVEYRLVGAPGWTTWGTFEIKGSEQKPVRRCFRKDNIGAGQYEVRCKLNSVAGTGSRYINTCFWSRLSHIVYDDFTYPNMVLIGIRAIATDKLNGGLPTVSWLQTRDYVWVYVPGSGYLQRSARNPAWICYDLIHRARRLYNVQTAQYQMVVQGEAYSKIDYSAFSAWASFCDTLVSGIKRCEVNIFLDAVGNVWDQLQKVAQTGRGMVVLKGTQFSAVWDGVSSPVQLFTVGNVILNSLSGDYIGKQDRANAVEISFINEAKNYQRDTIIVYGEDYDTENVIQNPVQIFLQGITNYTRAYREGIYRLRLNKYIRRTTSFQADVDAIACQVGDVILLQHDVPRWGYGGRLVAATDTVLTLDKSVLLRAGVSYAVMVRLADDTLVTKNLQAVAQDTETATVTVTSAFSVVPEQFDIFALGEVNKVAKPFRVTKISRTSQQAVKIDAVEYYAEIYDESATVPDIDYSIDQPGVRNLKLSFHFEMDGSAWLDIAWNPPAGSYGGAIVTVDGKVVTRTGMTASSYSHRVTADKTYAVKVTGLNAAGAQVNALTGSYTVTALSIPDVTNIVLDEDSYILKDGTVLTDVPLTFTLPSYRYFKQVNIYYQVDGAGEWKYAGSTTKGVFRVKALKASTVQIDIRVVNSWNVEGSPTTSSVLTVTGKSWPPGNVAGFTGTQSAYNKAILKFTWTAVDEPDILGYEIRLGSTWASALKIHEGFIPDPRFEYTLDSPGSKTFLIKARDRSGNFSNSATSFSINALLVPSSVTGFQGIQNGDKVLLTWNRVADLDVSGYEIREGPSFDLGSLVATGITGASFQAPVSSERTYTFWIKARNVAGYMSQTAPYSQVAVAGLLPRNYIASFDEIDLQSGTHTNTEFGTSFYTWGIFPGAYSDYPATRWDEVGAATVLKLSGSNLTGQYKTTVKDMGKIVQAEITARFNAFTFWYDTAYGKLQYRTSLDGVLWTAYLDFQPASATFRYLQFRVLLGRENTSQHPEVTYWVENIDVPDVDMAGKNVVVAVGGTTISYGWTYYEPPAVVATAIGSGVYAEIVPASVTETQFQVKVRNSSGTDVGGTINWMSKGY